MRIIFNLISLFLIANILVGQDTTTLNKWKRAIVQLESIGRDTIGYDKFVSDYQTYIDSLLKLLEREKISLDNFASKQDSFFKRNFNYNLLTFYGTALFVRDKSKRYLITARHVLHDENEAYFKLKTGTDSTYDSTTRFNSIYRIRNYDEYLNLKEDDSLALWLGASIYDGDRVPLNCLPYTFSNPDIDLAIWSLDNPFSTKSFKRNFADYLEISGYTPISFSDIADEPSQLGKEVFTVGFPGSISYKFFRKFRDDYQKYRSALMRSIAQISEPVFSFGKVATSNLAFPFFWVDMSIYPGNSGGPIVENNKLVGIVSRQARINLDFQNNPLRDYYTRIPFGYIIKAKYIKDLLKTQIEKDKFAEIEMKRIMKAHGH